MLKLNYPVFQESVVPNHEQITNWGNLVKQYENRELPGWTIEQIHDLLIQIQGYINSQSSNDQFFFKISPVMCSIFAATQILTGEAFKKNQQSSLEMASHQIYLTLKAICF